MIIKCSQPQFHGPLLPADWPKSLEDLVIHAQWIIVRVAIKSDAKGFGNLQVSSFVKLHALSHPQSFGRPDRCLVHTRANVTLYGDADRCPLSGSGQSLDYLLPADWLWKMKLYWRCLSICMTLVAAEPR